MARRANRRACSFVIASAVWQMSPPLTVGLTMRSAAALHDVLILAISPSLASIKRRSATGSVRTAEANSLPVIFGLIAIGSVLKMRPVPASSHSRLTPYRSLNCADALASAPA